MSGLGLTLLIVGIAVVSLASGSAAEEGLRARMERRPSRTGRWYALAFIGGVVISTVANAAARGAL